MDTYLFIIFSITFRALVRCQNEGLWRRANVRSSTFYKLLSYGGNLTVRNSFDRGFFLIDCPKTNSKVISPAYYIGSKQRNELFKIPNNHL